MASRIIPCLIALVLPAFAAAQTSQTFCQAVGGQLQCQTYAPPTATPPADIGAPLLRIPAETNTTSAIEEAYAIRQQQLQIQQQELQNQQIQEQAQRQRDIEQQQADAAAEQAKADADSQALSERAKLVTTRFAAIIDVMQKSKPCVDRFPHDSARFDQCLLDLAKQDPEFAAHLQMTMDHKNDQDYWKGLH